MKDSKLVQRVKKELGIDVEQQIRKEINKEKHPFADGYQLGRLYKFKAEKLLTNAHTKPCENGRGI